MLNSAFKAGAGGGGMIGSLQLPLSSMNRLNQTTDPDNTDIVS
jgi:hypothetical protein